MLTRLSKLLGGYVLPAIDYPFARSDVARYHATAPTPAGAAVDAQTWDDMLLDQYADALAPQTSIFGRQMLHRRLASGAADAASVARVRALAADGAALSALHEACASLRLAETEVAELLFGAGPPSAPRWSRYLGWLPLAFVGAVVLTLFWLPAWLLAVGGWIVLMGVQAALYEQAQQWERTMRTVQQLLLAHTLLGELAASATDGQPSQAASHAAPFRAGAAQAGRLSRMLGRSPLIRMIPGAKEYGEWVWLANIRNYYRGCDTVRAECAFLRDSYLRVASLDADLALARHVRAAPRLCWTAAAGQPADDRAARPAFAFDGVVHPLLEDAAPLTFGVDGQGAFISGQNGIGKSTLLRTVGLNLIAARAFGFCYADRATAPPLPVYSSMQNEDTLSGGESLYLAELRRARELLALAGDGPAIFIIDEIFRGTNHVESISVAGAVLHTLCQSGCVIVSSHNLVLAPLLAGTLAPWCVQRSGGQLHVQPGVLQETNGITLLAAQGFDAQISAKAVRIAGWLGEHMRNPASCDGVLRDAAA